MNKQGVKHTAEFKFKPGEYVYLVSGVVCHVQIKHITFHNDSFKYNVENIWGNPMVEDVWEYQLFHTEEEAEGALALLRVEELKAKKLEQKKYNSQKKNCLFLLMYWEHY